jgi:hypothetical protein
MAFHFAMIVANLDVPQKGKGLGFTKEVCNLQFQVHTFFMYLDNWYQGLHHFKYYMI